MNLVDSSGWLEFFGDGPNADFFTEPLNSTKGLIVPTLCIYEVFKKIFKERGEDAAIQAAALMQHGTVIDLNKGLSINAAKLSCDLKLPMADSIVLATAKLFNATIWTQDRDFEGLEKIKFIKREK